MIVRVTFAPDQVVLFGDSYKPWRDQFEEFVFLNREWLPPTPMFAEVSKSPWVSWGGLKWCPHETFQDELNREGCQAGDPDSPNARRYDQMIFHPDPTAMGQVATIVARIIWRLRPPEVGTAAAPAKS